MGRGEEALTSRAAGSGPRCEVERVVGVVG